MADALMSLSIDTADVLRLLNRVQPTIEPKLKAVAKVTADRICTEARRRVPVRTGRLRDSIEVREDQSRHGYVVGTFLVPKVGISLHTRKKTGRQHTQRVTQDNLPLWIEKGTAPHSHADARPFLDPAGKLEEGPHLRRLTDVLEDELRGLGE